PPDNRRIRRATLPARRRPFGRSRLVEENRARLTTGIRRRFRRRGWSLTFATGKFISRRLSGRGSLRSSLYAGKIIRKSGRPTARDWRLFLREAITALSRFTTLRRKRSAIFRRVLIAIRIRHGRWTVNALHLFGGRLNRETRRRDISSSR